MPGKEEVDKRKRRQVSKIEALPAEQDTACRASARRGCGSIDQRSKHVHLGQNLHRLRLFGPKSRYEKRGLSPKCDGPLTRAGPVSRVLFPGLQKARAPVIYLRRRSPVASSNLPPGIGRATLICRYTRSCNPQDVLSGVHHCLRGGLLPRLFTLTRRRSFRRCDTLRSGGYFLLRYHTLTGIKSLACAALCVARTFLPRPMAGSDRAGLPCKIKN